MAQTETYVDPSIAASSGSGTIGDPYGDLQYALNTMTRDATNGDRINIKAGTDEVLAAALSLATYGTPTEAAPLTFQGYTSSAGDGGEGGISGAGTYSIIATTTLSYINFVDLHLHNSGSARIIQVDNYCTFMNCDIENSTYATNTIDGDQYLQFINCYIHNHEGEVMRLETGGLINGCYFEPDGATPDTWVRFFAAGCKVINSIFVCGATAQAIVGQAGAMVRANSIYGASNTQTAIDAAQAALSITNNIISGFRGTGGIGINVDAADDSCYVADNAVYNCATPYNLSGDNGFYVNNVTLGADPFTDAANGDFSITDNADLKASGSPNSWLGLSTTTGYLDKGAVQREEPTASGGGRRPRARYHGV